MFEETGPAQSKSRHDVLISISYILHLRAIPAFEHLIELEQHHGVW